MVTIHQNTIRPREIPTSKNAIPSTEPLVETSSGVHTSGSAGTWIRRIALGTLFGLEVVAGGWFAKNAIAEEAILAGTTQPREAERGITITGLESTIRDTERGEEFTVYGVSSRIDIAPEIRADESTVVSLEFFPIRTRDTCLNLETQTPSAITITYAITDTDGNTREVTVQRNSVCSSGYTSDAVENALLGVLEPEEADGPRTIRIIVQPGETIRVIEPGGLVRIRSGLQDQAPEQAPEAPPEMLIEQPAPVPQPQEVPATPPRRIEHVHGSRELVDVSFRGFPLQSLGPDSVNGDLYALSGTDTFWLGERRMIGLSPGLDLETLGLEYNTALGTLQLRSVRALAILGVSLGLGRERNTHRITAFGLVGHLGIHADLDSVTGNQVVSEYWTHNAAGGGGIAYRYTLDGVDIVSLQAALTTDPAHPFSGRLRLTLPLSLMAQRRAIGGMTMEVSFDQFRAPQLLEMPEMEGSLIPHLGSEGDVTHIVVDLLVPTRDFGSDSLRAMLLVGGGAIIDAWDGGNSLTGSLGCEVMIMIRNGHTTWFVTLDARALIGHDRYGATGGLTLSSRSATDVIVLE